MTRSRGLRAPRRFWTDVELELLVSMYPDCHSADVAAWLGRPVGAVYQAAAAHGLRKSAEFLASDTACRITRGKQHPRMVATRFQPGMTPWNKGVPGSTGLHPNTRRTQFKKGAMSGAAQHNYVPIGTLRVTADGALERKVTDDPSVYPARRWKPVARLVWEAAHGPIPADHLVVFRPGLRTVRLEEITLDRLECISRAENARRNHPRNRSPELARLVQLKGAITRQVNRIQRETEQRGTTS